MKSNLTELQTIPGVGPHLSKDFWNIGLKKVSDLKSQDPEMLYKRISNFYGRPVDRCVLYVCRCAVYFAETKNPTSAKLKWWNWKE